MYLDNNHCISIGAFDKEFCDNIIYIGEKLKIDQARIQDGNNANRSGKVSWIKDNKVLNNKILKTIEQHNRRTNWNFKIDKLEPLQYSIYGINDHYDWHIDSHTKPYDDGKIRKISFTINLNEDYEGGEFELCTPTPKKLDKNIILNDLVLGTVISFPSFIWHKVHPVTSGVRKVLVGWTLGPTFK